MLSSAICILRPFRAILEHSRFLRPIVKLAKDKFQVSVDVRQFNKDEIRVKARKEFIVIEGKQERKMENGFVIRQFVRKYKLPSGCDPQKVFSTLTDNGMLTVTAPRDVSEDINLPTEIPIPIKFCGSDANKDPQCMQVDVSTKSVKSLCDYYLKKDEQSDQKNKPTCPPPPPKT